MDQSPAQKIKLEQISPKLDALARCLNRIDSKKPFSQKELESNFDLQDIVSVNLERSVQQAVDIATMILARSPMPIPAEMSEAFVALERLGWIKNSTADRMKRAVGFRNIAVHEYEKINWNVVFAITENHLNDFREFAREIIKKIQDDA